MYKTYSYISICILTLFLILIFIKFTKNSEKYLNALTILGIVIIFVIIIKSAINRSEEYKLQDDPKLEELKQIISPMFDGRVEYSGILEELNQKDVLNEIELYRGEKSYTINKRKIFLCLRDEKGEYYPDLQLIFVLLHELGHVLCKEVGHTQQFNDIFDALLDQADDMGIYDKDFPIIMDYCLYKKD